MNKFVSRKLIVAVAGLFVNILAHFGLDASVAEQFGELTIQILGVYMLGQSGVDIAEKIKERK